MMKLAYPMRFTLELGTQETYNVQGLPPLEDVITCGFTLEEAKAYARDALTMMLWDRLERNYEVPLPVEAKGSHIYWIEPDPEVVPPILLQWARKESGLTQADLAAKLGKPRQSITKLEAPGANPTIRTLAAIANALGYDLQIDFVKHAG